MDIVVIIAKIKPFRVNLAWAYSVIMTVRYLLLYLIFPFHT